MEYGKPFSKPPISKTIIPGGWTQLQKDSPYIPLATGFILDHIHKVMQIRLPNELRVKLAAAGGQIVSGIDTYLEFIIPASPGVKESYVRALVYDPVVKNGKHEHSMEVKNIFITSR